MTSDLADSHGSIQLRHVYLMSTHLWFSHCEKCDWSGLTFIHREEAVLEGYRHTCQVEAKVVEMHPSNTPKRRGRPPGSSKLSNNP